MKENKEEKSSTPKQAIEEAAFNNWSMTREQIQFGLKRDIRGIYVVLAEILQSQEVLDAITNVYYERYLKIKAEHVPTVEEVESDD